MEGGGLNQRIKKRLEYRFLEGGVNGSLLSLLWGRGSIVYLSGIDQSEMPDSLARLAAIIV